MLARIVPERARLVSNSGGRGWGLVRYLSRLARVAAQIGYRHLTGQNGTPVEVETQGVLVSLGLAHAGHQIQADIRMAVPTSHSRFNMVLERPGAVPLVRRFTLSAGREVLRSEEGEALGPVWAQRVDLARGEEDPRVLDCRVLLLWPSGREFTGVLPLLSSMPTPRYRGERLPAPRRKAPVTVTDMPGDLQQIEFTRDGRWYLRAVLRNHVCFHLQGQEVWFEKGSDWTDSAPARASLTRLLDFRSGMCDLLGISSPPPLVVASRADSAQLDGLAGSLAVATSPDELRAAFEVGHVIKYGAALATDLVFGGLRVLGPNTGLRVGAIALAVSGAASRRLDPKLLSSVESALVERTRGNRLADLIKQAGDPAQVSPRARASLALRLLEQLKEGKAEEAFREGLTRCWGRDVPSGDVIRLLGLD